MRLFVANFLEPISGQNVVNSSNWIWRPHNKKIDKIYASGAKTATRASTYASEKDDNADTDRPDEGP